MQPQRLPLLLSVPVILLHASAHAVTSPQHFAQKNGTLLATLLPNWVWSLVNVHNCDAVIQADPERACVCLMALGIQKRNRPF